MKRIMMSICNFPNWIFWHCMSCHIFIVWKAPWVNTGSSKRIQRSTLYKQTQLSPFFHSSCGWKFLNSFKPFYERREADDSSWKQCYQLWALNRLERVQLLVTKLEHPSFGFEQRNIELDCKIDWVDNTTWGGFKYSSSLPLWKRFFFSSSSKGGLSAFIH